MMPGNHQRRHHECVRQALAPEPPAHQRQRGHRSQNRRQDGGHAGDPDAQPGGVDPVGPVEVLPVPLQRESRRRKLQIAGRAERHRDHHENREDQIEQHESGDDVQDDAREGEPFHLRVPPYSLSTPSSLLKIRKISSAITSSTSASAAAKPQLSVFTCCAISIEIMMSFGPPISAGVI